MHWLLAKWKSSSLGSITHSTSPDVSNQQPCPNSLQSWRWILQVNSKSMTKILENQQVQSWQGVENSQRGSETAGEKAVGTRCLSEDELHSVVKTKCWIKQTCCFQLMMERKTPNKTQKKVPTNQQTLLHYWPNSLFQFIINKFPAFERPLEIYHTFSQQRVTVCASHSFLPKLVKDVKKQLQPSV